ncbi:hypothetical protein V1512DRAFT_257364 [Lipomyces arxii]|uniref:uncharacterized protein n=1 Tax=Lipomyces arxii TaxID=56418 RepID=UPI0034CF6F38
MEKVRKQLAGYKSAVESDQFARRARRSLRSIKYSRLSSMSRTFVIVFTFGGLIFLFTSLVGSKNREWKLPGDLDPSFLDTESRRCPESEANNPRKILSSVSNPQMSSLRAQFSVSASAGENAVKPSWLKSNPSFLPLPIGSEEQYAGFAVESQGNDVIVHACVLARGKTKVSRKLKLQCMAEPSSFKLEMQESRLCNGVPVRQRDLRVFLSPDGTPVMTYTLQTDSGCSSLWIIDARVLIPSILDYFPNPPLVYVKPTEIVPPTEMESSDENWVLLYEKNLTYVQTSLHPQYLFSLDDPAIILKKKSKCVCNLSQRKLRSTVRQSSNSLRLSLCAFPCTPTEANTVLVSIINIRHAEGERAYYERRAMVTNATYPFHILGFSRPLMYAGTDEQDMLYTTSLSWETRQSPRKDRPDVYSLDRSRYAVRTDDDTEQTEEPSSSLLEEAQEHEYQEKAEIEQVRKVEEWRQRKKEKQEKRKLKMKEKRELKVPHNDQNTVVLELQLKQKLLIDKSIIRGNVLENMQLSGFESDYYHGYLDDVVVIGFGINNEESGFLDVKAYDLVQCLTKCVE